MTFESIEQAEPPKIYANAEPVKRALETKRQQDRIQAHVQKCFTFGKPVRRMKDMDPAATTKVQILKRRFKRMELLRKYYSVKTADGTRPFDFPVNEDAD